MASAAAVATAAAAINADLMSEDTRSAVCAAASPFTAEIEARLAEKILGNRRHGLDDIFAGRPDIKEAR